jgi:cellulose synthase/poly-beta-1,6-N-acetylglucosamine synthase-like glycosyltransferase
MSFCHAATPGATTHALAERDMADRFDLSVVAPCYNEALGLAERRVSASCSKTVGTDYEIILVNNGS